MDRGDRSGWKVGNASLSADRGSDGEEPQLPGRGQSTRSRSERVAGAVGWKKGEKAEVAGPQTGGKAQWGWTP